MEKDFCFVNLFWFAFVIIAIDLIFPVFRRFHFLCRIHKHLACEGWVVSAGEESVEEELSDVLEVR